MRVPRWRTMMAPALAACPPYSLTPSILGSYEKGRGGGRTGEVKRAVVEGGRRCRGARVQCGCNASEIPSPARTWLPLLLVEPPCFLDALWREGERGREREREGERGRT